MISCLYIPALKDGVFRQRLDKEFENKQYIPTCIDKVIKEKVNRDFDIIFEALYLLERYRAEGLTHFDFNLEIILNKIIPKQK